MKIYFACPTGKTRDELVTDHGDKYGACLTRDLFNIKTLKAMPWFLDNGAFKDFRDGVRYYNADKFVDRLAQVEWGVRTGEFPPPDFVVVPDIVSGGDRSLEASLRWMDYLNDKFPYNKYYLAVQEDMSILKISNLLKQRKFDGLFVGGGRQWKYSNMQLFVDLAHKHKLPCHVGGIGTKTYYELAKMCGVDSVDSGIPMIHRKHLNNALNMDQTYKQNLFLAAA